jgi:hypothetical protein
MENQKLNTKELNTKELVTINGGSQWSDAICYYAGVSYRMLQAFSSGAEKGSANRFG